MQLKLACWHQIPITNYAFQRYTVCMHTSRLSLTVLFSLLCALLLAPKLLLADDAMAPPQVTTSGLASPATFEEGRESAPDLHDELNAPDGGSAVDVRSYKRKDGTRITEYGPKGRVTHIKVQPPGGLPAYYLYRNTAGTFERRLPGGAKAIAVPNWILKEF